MPDLLQRVLAAALLVLLSPALVMLALVVRADSRGPILFRAVRVGRDGQAFSCLKLRTMAWEPIGPGHGVTVASDPRITRSGHLLRRLRLDELPQLVNVIRGELRLVGPRPEEPRFVDLADPVHEHVFTAAPGITGLAQLFFHDEAGLLHGADPERVYLSVVQPQKLALDARYLANRSVVLDLRILAATGAAMFGWKPSTRTLDRWAPRPADPALVSWADAPMD